MDTPKLNYTTLWHIGLSYTSQKNQQFNYIQPKVWMNNTETEVTIPLTNEAGWVIFNLQSTGAIYSVYCNPYKLHIYSYLLMYTILYA